MHLKKRQNPYCTQNWSQAWAASAESFEFDFRNRDDSHENGFKYVLLIEWGYDLAIWLSEGVDNQDSPTEWVIKCNDQGNEWR